LAEGSFEDLTPEDARIAGSIGGVRPVIHISTALHLEARHSNATVFPGKRFQG
jgi:hypothetical protein